MNESMILFYLDDDHDDLAFFKEAAENLGHLVATFSTAQELLLTLHLEPQKPDAIFLDVHMPILAGEEILNVLKRSQDWGHIPVVMLSGAYPKKLVHYFTDNGANHLMKKRASIHDAESEIEQALTAVLPKPNAQRKQA